MTRLQRLFRYLQKKTSCFALFLLPYYFFRFIYSSLKERSLWFYRYPMGHFGSTIPSKLDLITDEGRIFNKTVGNIPGIELNVELQLGLLSEFSKYNRSFASSKHPQGGARYYSENYSFRSADALILYCMIRHYQVPKIIEIGSGFSSALMLDIRNSKMPDLDLTFIEPYPVTLNNVLSESDQETCTIIQSKIQDVSMDTFDNLQPNSILFIDSSHVLKVGSDLSTIVFSILPRLQPGVLVHFHDIFWPFEYPKEMIYEGRLWNEIYFVRTFLQFNDSFDVILFPSFLEEKHSETLRRNLPSYSEFSASSLWMVRKPNAPRSAGI